jgi:glucose/arabinose dehydrogenase
MPEIGSGTLGLALHPDFQNPATPFIYFVYSYNGGTEENPQTLWKLSRLRWSWKSQEVTGRTDLVLGISNGYDHWGGRLMAIQSETDTVPYLYLSIGDHGISETNSPDCYTNQAENPNNFAQNVNTDNGKIHRYNMDGSIPADNPIPGNSIYTRGHRNPQGLMYIPEHDLLFDVEHGDRTDDEINLLEKGMNYGWKWVRGYHDDNNYPGEAEFIANYVPHPMIENDRLVEAFYSFCDEPQPESEEYLEWCTPAPSDGIYYNSDGIPEWKNSLLVVSLKNGTTTDNEVHVLKLTSNGQALLPSTAENPNPQAFFGQDQELNGRLRDITFSPDGKKIFLINNGGEGIAQITVYTVESSTATADLSADAILTLYPNPTNDLLSVQSKEGIEELNVFNVSGELIHTEGDGFTQIDVRSWQDGVYVARIVTPAGNAYTQKFIKQ